MFTSSLRSIAVIVFALSACNASALPRADIDTSAFANCANGVLVSTTQMAVGDITVDRETIYCAPPSENGQRISISISLCRIFGVCSQPHPIPTVTQKPLPTNEPVYTSAIATPSATPIGTPRKVCGLSCTPSCNNQAGRLPPITEDCAAIYDALVLFGQSSVPSFVTHPDSVEQFTVGTCRVFFQNTGKEDLEYCWKDLKSAASTAGSFCFPPVQPFSSQGQCGSSDGAWHAGVAHA